LKNKEAKMTGPALLFLHNAKISLCLTGTPILNRPVELYTQLNGLLRHVFNDYDAFTERYCDAKEARFGQAKDVSGKSNLGELKLILEGMVMIRRMKMDFLKDLPEKMRTLRCVTPDLIYLEEIKKLQKDIKKIDISLNNDNLDAAESNGMHKYL
jgi:SWI/SNF-related matrix-associated actin-dependent regulator 1 of chromatin subfamily A